MKRRWFLLLILVVSLLLAACQDNETTLTFTNKTECGIATIKITNTESGTVEEQALSEGRTLTVEIEPAVIYRYEVTYAGRPGSDLNCADKSGTVMVPKRGQDSNFTLIGVTPTPKSD
ncbi:MAG: hypothetical protein JXJ20_05645 [Anaerolineae bacterium]|jgi:hypothetical protein|nr:hypothetical protein [Anaerolineae bacterium]